MLSLFITIKLITRNNEQIFLLFPLRYDFNSNSKFKSSIIVKLKESAHYTVSYDDRALNVSGKKYSLY